jgi:hypothetical protein
LEEIINLLKEIAVLFKHNAFLTKLLSDTYPLSKNLIDISCLVLPVLFSFCLYRIKWVAFLLGLISFVLMASVSSILECIVPNGHCSSENLDGTFFQMFIVLGFFYNLFVLIFKDLVSELRR